MRVWAVYRCSALALRAMAAAVTISFGGATSAQELQGAQDAAQEAINLPIIAFDRERIQTSAHLGLSLAEQIEELQQALVAENAQIFADLEAEETEITQLKESLSELAFAARAKAFDEKVTQIRSEQAAKAKEVEAQYELNLRAFDQNLNVVLAAIARDYNAVAVFERQQLYLMSGAIDVSAEVIRRLDMQSLGTGQSIDLNTAPAALEE